MKKLLALLFIAQVALAADFVVYGPSVTNNISSVLEDGGQVALTLTNSLPSDEVYMLWPTNVNGYGTPVVINQTEAWWVGPDTLATGETFAVYGRNLDLGSATNFLYCTTTSEWLTNTVSNPYRSEFTVPTNWTNGTYSFRMHNGKGREYGWSDALGVTVRDKLIFDGDTNTVAAFTEAAIESAINGSSSGDVVYFPNGTYTVSGRIDMYDIEGIKLLGESRDGVVIETDSSFSATALVIGRLLVDVYFEDLTFEIQSDTVAPLFFLQNNSHVTFDNCVLDTTDWTMSSTRDNTFELRTSDYTLFTNCTIYVSGSASTADGPGSSIFINDSDQLFFEDCDFIQINDTAASIALYGDDSAFINCTQDSLSQTNPNDGYGWGKGRFIVSKNSSSNPQFGWSKNIYIGGCSLLRTGPREGAQANSGEVILGESPTYIVYTNITASTPNSITIPGVSGISADSLATIVTGKGFGQTRRVLTKDGWTVYMTENWRVQPDTSSTVVFYNGTERIVVYDNYVTGRDGIVDWGVSDWQTPNCAVEMYTAGRDWIIDGNTANGTRNGVVEFNFMRGSPSDDTDRAYATPCYFTYIANNVISNTYFGLVNQIRLKKNAPSHTSYPLSCGTVWRNNTVSNITETAIWNGVNKPGEPTGGMRLPDSNIQQLAVYQDNALYEFATEFETRSGFTNQVYIGNTTNSTPWSPSP